MPSLCGVFDCWRTAGRQTGKYSQVSKDSDSPVGPAKKAVPPAGGVGESFCEVRCHSLGESTTGAEDFLARLSDSCLVTDGSETEDPTPLPSPTPSAPSLPSADANTPEQQIQERTSRRQRALTEVLQSGTGSVFKDLTNAPAALTPTRAASASKIGSRLPQRSPLRISSAVDIINYD